MNSPAPAVAPEVQTPVVPRKSFVESVLNLGSVLNEDRFFLIISVFIGVFSGLSVVCFRLAIDWVRVGLLGPAPHAHDWRLLVVPPAVSLLIAVLVIHVFPLVRGSGVNQTKAALYIFNGYIPFRTAIGKFITAALAIGCGHSLGPEDPSLQIGASIASALGRRMNFSREKLRLLAPIGAAAGLAAAFNAPISAVLFVIEEVIGRWTAGILGSVVLSAISSVVIVRWFFGSDALFRIPIVTLVHPVELAAYAVLGLAGALLAVAFSHAISFLRPRVRAWPRTSQYFLPSCAGVIIGLFGYLGAPQVMGAGYQYMDEAMHGHFTWQFLALLVLLKIVATVLSFVSGTPGGMFAPTLFIGAMLGGSIGGLEHILYPHLTGTIGTYALVGMGVLFAAFLRAPMTSVFMVLEVSGSYSIILPVIVANTIAYVLSRTLQPTAIFDILTRQDGLDLPSMEEQREEHILRVEDAMEPYNGPVLNSGMSIAEANKRITDVAGDTFLVQVHPSGWTSASRDLLRRLVSEGKADLTLASALPSMRLPYMHPDFPLDSALRYVSETPIVPVVSRADFSKLEGVISSQAVLNRYRVVPREL